MKQKAFILILLGFLVACEAPVESVLEETVVKEVETVDEIETPSVEVPPVLEEPPNREETIEQEKEPVVEEPKESEDSSVPEESSVPVEPSLPTLTISNESVDVCKLTDGLTDFRGPAGIGNDIRRFSLPGSGTIKIAVFYLDFADYRWQREESTYELTHFLIEPIQAYYDAMSGNRVEFVWDVSEDIISLPLKAEDYDITRGSYGIKVDTKNVVGNILQSRYDLTEWDVIIWGINPDVPERLSDVSPTSIIVGQNESYAYHMALIGMDTRRNGYVNIAHEFGHMFGLPDLYVNVCVNNEDCMNGTVEWRLQFQHAGGWSLMSAGDHPNNELTGWERFIIGWIEDEDVYCIQERQEHTIHLNPLNSEELGSKLVTINLSESTNLVLEMRAPDNYCRTCQTGVLVYRIDINAIAHVAESAFLKVIQPEHTEDEFYFLDALLLNQPGHNKLDVDGWSIEVIDDYLEGLIVKVTPSE
jgi:M6 family metalloprotease-like protein